MTIAPGPRRCFIVLAAALLAVPLPNVLHAQDEAAQTVEKRLAEPVADEAEQKPQVRAIRAVRIGQPLNIKPAAPAQEVEAETPPETKPAETKVAEKAEPASDGLREGLVSLINGNTIAGVLKETDSPDVLRWHGSDFVEPFELQTDAIKSIKFPAARQRAKQQGEFAFELVSGDLLSGNLVSWDADTLQIDSSHFGKVTLNADSVRRMYRIAENPTLVFASLSGLQDWEDTGAKSDAWQEDGAHILTDQDDVLLNGDLGIPDKAMIEFEVSWTAEKPNFAFVMAADPDGRTDGRLDGWRIETFEETLVLVRETAESADLLKIDDLKDKKSIHLIAYLDQESGALELFRPDGASVGRVNPPDGEDGKPLRGVRLVNRHGGMRLSRLRIARWTGRLPKQSKSGDVSVALIDGGVESGESIRMDDQNNSLVLATGENESSIPLQDIVSLKIASEDSGTLTYRPLAKTSVFLHDGTRVSGDIQEITADHWTLKSKEFTQPVSVARPSVRTMIVMKRDPIPTDPKPSGRSGRLELGSHKLTGRLAPAVERDFGNGEGVSCLRWQPFGSLNGSPLKINASGRIVYRDPPPKPTKVSRTAERALQMQKLRLQQQKRGLNFGQLFLQRVDSKPIAKPVGPDAHRLHVRSGDIIPCLVDSIDEEGVRISTAVADDAFIPHIKIKAIELVTNATPPDLKQAKKDRLLTLPRLQKNSPPTHLLCSTNGDFLRCRLLGINDTTIRVELQLDEMEIPRDRVAQIIWFHPEELLAKEAEKGEEAAKVASPFDRMAQVLKRDGKRVTFDPQKVDDKLISGVSEVLGPCRFDLEEIDQLLFGEGIRDAVSVLAYNQWQLKAAVEPLMAQAGNDGSPPEVGSESPLIGQDAPEIKLELLDGDRFVLSQCRDQIVVLDFWATWCAPCMQTMPLVEEAIAEFDPAQVKLVSVNLEESADHVRAVLERHKMNVTVALDIDGVAAARYQARAIPQMVIVDKDGKIARLYVGGGSKMVDQIKDAIKQLLDPTAS